MSTPVGGMPRVDFSTQGVLNASFPSITQLRAMASDSGQHENLLGILQFNPPPYISVQRLQAHRGQEPEVFYQETTYQDGTPPAVRRSSVSDFLTLYDPEHYHPREIVRNWFYGDRNVSLTRYISDGSTGWLTRDELRFILMDRSLWGQVYQYLRMVPNIESLGEKYKINSFDASTGIVSYTITIQGSDAEDTVYGFKASKRLNEFVEGNFGYGTTRVVENDPGEQCVVIHWSALGIDPSLRSLSQPQALQTPSPRSVYMPTSPRGPVEVGGEMTVGPSHSSIVAMMSGSRAADLVSGRASCTLSSGPSIRREVEGWAQVGNLLRFDPNRQCDVFKLPQDSDWYVLSRYNSGAQWDNDPRVTASFEKLVNEMNSKSNGQAHLVLVPIRDESSTATVSRLHVMIRRVESGWQIRSLDGDVSILSSDYKAVAQRLARDERTQTTFISSGQRIALAPGVVIEMGR